MQPDPILDALGDRSRRSILAMLRRRPHGVGELAAAMPVSQPAVSQHLRVLREAGLVESRKDGRRRIYSVRAEGFEPLSSYVSAYWGTALDAFKTSFESRPAGRSDRHKE